ncbi:5'-3' DNA helicase ZGRF1 [Tiliqua scincoides]|uniref:5'-3' DNA helicase ZGRF1 n=1 Tax=Tiliqua scincoides TaxID=71010 RepID=UPI003462F12B
MACQEFAVLYTHQKTKKSKIWQDGILKSTVGGNKATLFDDKGQILDSIFVKFQIKPGDDLESERYLITVEDENTSETGCNDQPKNTTVSILTRNNSKFPVSSLCLPMGLKRKFSGFQGPRQVEKKIIMEDTATMTSPSHKIPQSSFPSQFYDSSPLFSVPYKKRKEISLLPNIDRDAVITDERDPGSAASMAFVPCVDYHKVVPSRNYSTGSGNTEYGKTQAQLDNGMDNSNYHASSDGAVSYNIRSKAQIIALLKFKSALLSKEQKECKTPLSGTTTSLTNLSLELERRPGSLSPSELPRSTDILFKPTVSPFLESKSNSNEETSASIQTLHLSKKSKSRWDTYLPLCVAEESPDLLDAGHNDKNASDLQPVKDLKDDGNVNRSQCNEDHKGMPQLPASLENCISSISECCVKTSSCSFVPNQSSMNEEGDIEVSSSNSAHYSNYINKTKIFANELSESSKHAMINTLKGFCHQSQSEPYPMLYSEHVSDHFANKHLGDLDKQFPDINFNLVDTVDLSETEDEELQANSTLSQGSVCLEEKTETQLETVVQKNCELEACSNEVKDNLLSAFSQDTGINCIMGSQPVQFLDEISENPNQVEENCVTFHFPNECRHPEPAIFENRKATSINHIAVHNNLDCRSRDLLMDNNGHCTQTTQLGKPKPNMKPYVPSTSDIYFKNDEIEGDNSQLCSTDICDNMKPASPLQSSIENNSYGDFPQYIFDHHNATLEKSSDLDFRPVAHLLKDETPSEETEISNNKLENAAVVLDSNYKSTDDKEKDFICLKSSTVDSSSFPKMVNSFNLLRSLTEHSTALESLQVIEESTDVLFQRETPLKTHVSSGESEARQAFFEVSCIEDGQISCAPLKIHSFSYNDIEKPTAAITKEVHDQHPFGVGDSEPKAVEFQGYQVKGSATSEIMVRESCSHLKWDPHADMIESKRVTKDAHFFSARESSSTIPSDFIEMPSTQWIPLQTPDSPFSPWLRAKGTAGWQEQAFLSTIIAESMDNTKNFFKMEESSSPEEEMSLFLSTVRTQAPVVTVPVDEELPDSQVFSNIKACEPDQQSCGFPVVNFYDKSQVLGPEDTNCEMSVHTKCTGERQGVLPQSAFPNVSEQKRQSKWQKYQNTIQCDLRTQNSSEMTMTDDFRAESVLGMPLDDTGESGSDAINESPPDFVHLQMIKSMLCKQQRNFSSEDSVSEEKELSLHLNQIFSTEEAPKVLGQLNCHNTTRHAKTLSELFFPSAEIINCANVPKRQICIPADFQSPAHYKQVFTAALIEHLNILLLELSQKLHKALGKVDISFYTSVKGGVGHTEDNSAPLCNHKIATKLLTVRKEGRNKGRLFYACDAPKADRCDFFTWLDDVNTGQIESGPSLVFHDMKSVGTYLRSQNISLYEECQLLVRKAFDMERKQVGKLKKFNNKNANFDYDCKTKLYLKLKQKENSYMFSKDDLWVVSKTLTFEPMDNFIACSVFFGPSSSNEIELVPLKGYSPSNWRSNMIVHALLVCNASTELVTLRNIEENFNSATLPIMQHLLTMPSKDASSSNRVSKRKFKPPALSTSTINCGLLSPEMMITLANRMIETFQLNKDQAMALIQIGSMMTSGEIDAEKGKRESLPITVIHGVFGSGKSYLLAIVILFLVQIFETSEATNGKNSVPWKVLLSSSTNVAVDRVLLCLLDLGFEEFIRVGSIRKIAKPVLPHSLHAGTGPENEQLKELFALMKGDLTPAEKIYVRKTIQHHKLGTNKARLQQVRVVGATCAACPFPCMKNLKFHIVVLDECSQMTEPASLLPIARFNCEKLILVGDPKQLPPTIQGSESAHGDGLEQTLFDRLCLMGHEPILLRTQYRCHPAISAITNDLFYGGNLLNGISEKDRNPLVDWLPTLCFYNVNGFEQVERDNSFHNMAESVFIVKLIQSLIASGIDGSMIGVIALYKSQMNKICTLLGAVHSDASQIKAVQVSTVDAFQGAEKEIIVLSCVRTRQVGFIDSERRVNVALTRGKRHLLIVGNLNCLRKNKLWGNVIQHCAGRKNGLQHADQCEQRLNDILNSERKKEEEINKQKEKSKRK